MMARSNSDPEPSADAPESVHTLVMRYDELDSLFPDELREKALPFFIDWLKDRVQPATAAHRCAACIRPARV
jgi:hypothetical protein